MKKGLSIAIVVVVLLYPAGAWLMGYGIEHRVDDFVQQFNVQNPYVKVTGNQFHRGWFSSDQELTVEPAQPALGAGAIKIVVHNVIHHGPICGISCIGLARIDSHFVFNEEIQPYIKSVFGSAEPLTVTSRLGLFGGGSAHISSPVIADANVAGGHLTSEGLDLKSDYSTNFDSYSLNGSLPHLSYVMQDGKRFEVSQISADVHSQRALRTLYTGDSAVTVAQMSFGNPAGPGAFAASDFRITSHSAVADQFLTAAIKYSIATITAAPVTLTGTQIDLTFRHIDADSFEQLTTTLRNSNRDTTIGAQDRAAKMAEAVKPVAAVLLAKQPEISIDQIVVATAAGSASMKGLIKFQNVSVEDFDKAASMLAMAKKIDVDMDVSIDEAFLNSLPGGAGSAAKLDPFVKQGLATRDNGKFHTTVGFHAGQTTFNGKPFGPPVAEQK